MFLISIDNQKTLGYDSMCVFLWIIHEQVRKLEFLLADALDQQCDTVLTCGGVQSNHCRATAVAARELGMDSYLFLRHKEQARASVEDPHPCVHYLQRSAPHCIVIFNPCGGYNLQVFFFFLGGGGRGGELAYNNMGSAAAVCTYIVPSIILLWWMANPWNVSYSSGISSPW